MLFCTWSIAFLLGESCEFSEWLAVCRSGGAAFVTMVKPADLGKRYYVTLVRYLNRSRVRDVPTGIETSSLSLVESVKMLTTQSYIDSQEMKICVKSVVPENPSGC